MFMLKFSKKEHFKIIKLSFCAAFLCLSVVYAQKNKVDSTSISNIILPRSSEVSMSADGLVDSSFQSSSIIGITYAPRKSESSSLSLFIDQKLEKVINRKSYDLNSYFENRRNKTDINTGPFYIIDARFSRDGDKVVFKYLISDQSYNIFCLDLKSNRLYKVEGNSTYYKYISISPDGRSVAYVQGGDDAGNVFKDELGRESYIGPLKLIISNIDGSHKNVIAEDDYINGKIGWDLNGSLIYGMRAKAISGIKKNSAIKLNIYSYNTETRKTALLAENGVMPSVSSDGRRIIFFGPPDKSTLINWSRDWRERPPSGVSLLSTSRAENSRIAFGPISKYYPAVRWLPDNTRFVSLRQTIFALDALAQLRLWNVETQDTSVLAEIKAKDASKMTRRGLYPQFDILDATASKIFVSRTESAGLNPLTGETKIRDSVVTTDISDGRTTEELSSIDNLSLGYDIKVN